MKLRNKAIAAGALLATTILAGPALAIGAPFSAIDANGDGMLSKQELSDIFGAENAGMALEQLDTDKDGSVSLAEAGKSDGTAPEPEETDPSDIDFEEVDANGDGMITEAELAAVYGKEDAGEIMNRLTGGTDGKVSLDDFYEAIAAVLADEIVASVEEGEIHDLDTADANGDGNLSKKELADAFGADFARQVLEDLDTDGDGTVTQAEFDALADGVDVAEAGDDELDLYSVDLDGDGRITREELEAFIGDSADDALSDFDEDEDGAIGFDELDRLYGDAGDEDTDMADDEDEDEDEDEVVELEDTDAGDDGMMDGDDCEELS